MIYFLQMRLDSFGYGWSIQRLPHSYFAAASVNPDVYETSRCFGSRQESLIEALLDVYLQVIAYRKKSFLRPVKKEVVCE
ncbi:MAG: hypothetical protein IM553_15845 [Microcystis sp. M57BS1]|uniref:hypothetical protein n=1 Tax=unclassified Microcystis TaxID=2643300 RepID=UPI002587CEA5|nr:MULTISPECIES: hypothetical protein [unclassified Microcystis]MCA2505433.1 hypothetical protein [Microcystis sp. M62BS1]MCA2509221.1 hypothetical protein [Microcystis sp. M60BS1]MCA2518235.1 hypothetical protein [Microcystis sp. M59BS1]MCA2535829.1 hypothetical protein [Microcystis sp. M57BS1]MCA2549677.1 hypothetical protein [Microcystis sp. M53BS1]MCA2576806.1 hypothetical protein [Microcystis sp. M41BS1]MCA2637778.1 hypothetical protein [Microcystis sp. M18BS1]